MEWGRFIRTSRNLILTAGREIEKNSREKASLFFFPSPLWIEKLKRALRALPQRNAQAYANVRKEEKCILVHPSLSPTKALSYILRQVVSPHWFTRPLRFLPGISRGKYGKYGMDWKNLRIAVRWFKDLRD